MKKFTTLKGIPANLPMINIDTDMIIPKQFLKTIKRTGLGKSLFFEMRYDTNGGLIKDFILNKDHYSSASIIVAGDNFGCGSSREHAPWALKDFGIKCVIAPSFADIFYGNCFKNGLLPVQLSQEVIEKLFEKSLGGLELTIDLFDQVVIDESGESYYFEIDPGLKAKLVDGQDEISLSLEEREKILAFEEQHKKRQSWLFGRNSDL